MWRNGSASLDDPIGSTWGDPARGLIRSLSRGSLLGSGLSLAGSEHDGEPSCDLSITAREVVRKRLPPGLQLCDWVLLYSTEKDGRSLRTLLGRLEAQGPTIIVVTDLEGRTLGGFARESWRVAHYFYGSGESFLFTVVDEGKVEVYPWSGDNCFFQLARPDSIAFGAGGHFGLWLDKTLENGYSGECETFHNPPLGSNREFGIAHVQAWGFQRPCTLHVGKNVLTLPVEAYLGGLTRETAAGLDSIDCLHRENDRALLLESGMAAGLQRSGSEVAVPWRDKEEEVVLGHEEYTTLWEYALEVMYGYLPAGVQSGLDHGCISCGTRRNQNWQCDYEPAQLPNPMPPEITSTSTRDIVEKYTVDKCRE